MIWGLGPFLLQVTTHFLSAINFNISLSYDKNIARLVEITEHITQKLDTALLPRNICSLRMLKIITVPYINAKSSLQIS